MESEFKIVREYLDRIGAQMGQAQLVAEGIESWVDADDAGGIYPQLQAAGVRLRVRANDFSEARDILAAEVVEPLE